MKKNAFSLLMFVVFSTIIFAQPNQLKTKATLSRYFKYWGIEDKVPSDTLTNWATMLTIAEDENKADEERKNAYHIFCAGLFNAMGDNNTALKQRLFVSPGTLAIGLLSGRLAKLEWPEQKEITPENEIGKIVKRGSGPNMVIVIPSFSFDASVFEKFIALNSKEYTYFIISMPGTDNIPAYKIPEKREFSKTRWLNSFSKGIAGYITKNKFGNVTILAQAAALNIACKVAELVPAKISRIINLTGAGVSLSPTNPAPGTVDYEKSFPVQDLQRGISLFQTSASYQNPFFFNRDLAIKFLESVDSKLNRFAFNRYNQENLTINVSAELKKLKIPLLVVLPVHDDLSPAFFTNRANIQAWYKFKMRNPSLSLEIATVPGRALFFTEYPERVSPVFKHFVATNIIKPSEELVATHAIDASPGAITNQTFNNTDITINYHRPSVKGRQIFGGLVPYGQVWRAGADEATEISFSRNVVINNKVLNKGTYSLFVIPEKNKWTFVFNRLLNQWGQFHYDSTFDVLRIESTVTKTDPEEFLKYDFTSITDNSLDVVLKWDSVKASFRVTETFQPPLIPEKLSSAKWIKLLEDKENDGANLTRPSAATADGKALYYYFEKQTDTLWFKLETYTKTDMFNPAMSISLDIDNNQSTGTNWYGSNTAFKTDMMLSSGPVRQGDGYLGYNGITNADGIKKGDWINVKENVIRFYFDPAQKAIIMGVKRSDIQPGLKKFNLIGSVGNVSAWNDDIGKDGTYATIELEDN